MKAPRGSAKLGQDRKRYSREFLLEFKEVRVTNGEVAAFRFYSSCAMLRADLQSFFPGV